MFLYGFDLISNLYKYNKFERKIQYFHLFFSIKKTFTPYISTPRLLHHQFFTMCHFYFDPIHKSSIFEYQTKGIYGKEKIKNYWL